MQNYIKKRYAQCFLRILFTVEGEILFIYSFCIHKCCIIPSKQDSICVFYSLFIHWRVHVEASFQGRLLIYGDQCCIRVKRGLGENILDKGLLLRQCNSFMSN